MDYLPITVLSEAQIAAVKLAKTLVFPAFDYVTLPMETQGIIGEVVLDTAHTADCWPTGYT